MYVASLNGHTEVVDLLVQAGALVTLRPLVSLTIRFIGRSAKMSIDTHIHTHTHTHRQTQTKYRNPRHACSPRVNKLMFIQIFILVLICGSKLLLEHVCNSAPRSAQWVLINTFLIRNLYVANLTWQQEVRRDKVCVIAGSPVSFFISMQDGVSPVYAASKNGHTEVVDLLVQAGADIHLATTDEVHIGTHTVSSSVATVVETNVKLNEFVVYDLHFH